jgi:hypothetical protein
MLGTQEKLQQSLQSTRRVGGFTHNFYRYPARFAPEFAREIILSFSKEGDFILDAFMGGGTSVVEAVANGRYALGVDINPLAHFITKSKTTPLSSRDQDRILYWANMLNFEETISDQPAMTDSRLRNLPVKARELLTCAVLTLSQLEFPRQRNFARCALLRLGQWMVDCRNDIPPAIHVRKQFLKQVTEMLKGLDSLVEAAKSRGIPKNKITGRRILYLGTANEVVQNRNSIRLSSKPKLILTSPPYPGVHVLYHRWQVDGRRETPAPYWLANLRDGHGESFYTLGGRSEKGLQNYFNRLTGTFQILRQIIDPDALVVQLVAFANPDAHLHAFLTAMMSAGYEEINPFGGSISERPLRKVPNRKWYTQLAANQFASSEILLFHRPRM